jgi:hypothetical protein
MADTDLPEGTDTIVSGAMDKDTDSAPKRSATARRTPTTSRKTGSTSGTGTTTSSGGTTALMDRVRSGTDKLSGQAADKARDFVRQGMERSAEAIANIATLVGDTASGIDENIGQDYGDYARRASESLREVSDRLAAKDPDELIEDTRRFVRKSPGVALAGAAIVGFALARMVKAGFSSDRDDEDDRD